MLFRSSNSGMVVLGRSELRMIATVAELDALPLDSVILDDGWYPKVKGHNNKWWRPDCRRGLAAEGIPLPTRLLWTPEDD